MYLATNSILTSYMYGVMGPNHCLGTGSTDPYTVGPGTEARAGSGIETDTDN